MQAQNSLRTRVPVGALKTISQRSLFTLDALIERMATPQEPPKSNDLFVLAVFGITAVCTISLSGLLIARYFGA